MASPIGKYAPLHTYLVGQTAKAVVLSFYSVEQILGFKLPLSARHRREWWGNENQATTRHTIHWRGRSPDGRPTRTWAAGRSRFQTRPLPFWRLTCLCPYHNGSQYSGQLPGLAEEYRGAVVMADAGRVEGPQP